MDWLLVGKASARQLGELVGLHERQVRKLAERAIIERDGDGRYDLAPAVHAYCGHLRRQAAGREAGGEDEAPVLAQERAMLVRRQREAYELKNAALRGELLPIDQVEHAVGALLTAVRQKLLAVPTKAAPLCAGVHELGEVRETLTQLVHDALSDLASADLVIDGIADRAGANGAADAEAAEPASATAAADREPVGG